MASNVQFYLNWAKERIDEMDAVLTSLQNKASQLSRLGAVEGQAGIGLERLPGRRQEVRGKFRPADETAADDFPGHGRRTVKGLARGGRQVSSCSDRSGG